MSFKDKISFHDLKDLSGKEISKKLKTGEFGLSPEEVGTYKEFVSAAPGSEARLKILSDRQETPKGVVPGSDEPVNTPPYPAPTNEDVTPVEINPDDPTVVVPDKPKALESEEEEIKETSVIPIEKYADALQERDAHRRSNSKLGNENRELQAQLAEMKKALAEKAAGAEPEVVTIEAPLPPAPEDFEEGTVDAEYISAQSKYAKDYKDYVENSGKVPPAWAQTLIDKVEKNEARTEQALSYATTEQQAKAETIQDKGWNDMWANTVEIQKKLNLPTGSLTPEQLNYYVLRAGYKNNSEGQPKYSASEVESANAFMKEVPKDVLDNFTKLSSVMNDYYDFSGDIPTKASDLADEFLLPGIVKKLGIEVDTVVPVANPKPSVDQLSEHQIKVSQQESAQPAAELGSGADTLDNSMSDNDKIQKYIRMSKTYLKNAPACEKNLQWMDEFNSLKQEVSQYTE